MVTCDNYITYITYIQKCLLPKRGDDSRKASFSSAFHFQQQWGFKIEERSVESVLVNRNMVAVLTTVCWSTSRYGG